MTQKMLLLPVSVLALQLATTGFAETFDDLPAFNTATIQQGGPRSDANASRYLNIENNGNSAGFRSYGILDFQTFLLPLDTPFAEVNSITFDLVDTRASFSTNASFGIYLVSDFDTPFSSLTYDSSASGGLTELGGVDQTEFADGTSFYYLGVGNYAPVSNGTQFSLTVDLDPVGGAAMAEIINNYGNLRFLFTPDNTAGTEAATLAGFGNGAGFGGPPRLDLEYTLVPEPSSALLLGLAGTGLLLRRRRRQLAA